MIPWLPLACSRGNSSPCFREPPEQHFCAFSCLAFSPTAPFPTSETSGGSVLVGIFFFLRLICPRAGWLVGIISTNQPLRLILLCGKSQLLLLLLSAIIWFQKWPCAQSWPHFSSACLPKNFLCHFQSCPSPWKWFSSLMVLRHVTFNMMWQSVRKEVTGRWWWPELHLPPVWEQGTSKKIHHKCRGEASVRSNHYGPFSVWDELTGHQRITDEQEALGPCLP